MNLHDLLREPPMLHRVGPDTPISYRLSDEALYFIDGRVGEGSKTLETGAGISTLLFAIKGTRHTCVVPDEGLVNRISEYCARHQLHAGRIDFRIDRSENVLPRLRLQGLDLVVIDGRHAFPTPFIDWYYTAGAIKVGGLLLIDDTQLWTGDLLKKFLVEEPEWELIKDFSSRSAAFVKLKEGSHNKWWGEQPYLVRKSKNLRRVAAARQALDLLRGGRFTTLLEKLKKNR